MFGLGFATICKRSFATTKYFHEPRVIRSWEVDLYKKQFKVISTRLGLKKDQLYDFTPQFNRSCLTEELKQLVPLVPDAQKPVVKVKVLLRGIGFRASFGKEESVKGELKMAIRLRLGVCHEYRLWLPDGVDIKDGDLKENTFKWVAANITPSDCQELVLSGKDKHKVTQFAAKIFLLRKPDRYKQKGVFIDSGTKRTNIIRKKAKSAKGKK